MDNYKPVVGIEPINKYEKAKQDLLQALKSYGDLTSEEKECLIREFFDSSSVAMICNILKQHFD